MSSASTHSTDANFPETTAPADGPERRTHLRLSADDVLWLLGVRIKYGADVRVVDISAGGMLVEAETELRPDATVVFEVSRPDSTLLVPARVLRCQRITVAGMSRFQAACAFKRPLSMPDLVARAASEVQEVPAAPKLPPGQTGRAIGQKVVARFLDGRLVRGYTNDFNASKPHLHLTEDNANRTMFVKIAQLKALFFVRAFEGNASRTERKEFTNATHGRRVEVTFRDGEILVGTTLGFNGAEHPFFVQPADAESNNIRVFVTPAATRQVRFV